MRTSSGTSSASVIPFSSSPSTSTPAAPDSGDDQTNSFSDVLQQHSGGSSSNTPAKASTKSTPTATSTASTAPTTSTKGTMTIVPPATVSPTQSGKLPTIAGLAQNAAATAATMPAKKGAPVAAGTATSRATKPDATAGTSTTSTTSAPVSAGSDMASLMIQAMLLATNLRSGTPTTTPTTPAATTPGAATTPNALAAALPGAQIAATSTAKAPSAVTALTATASAAIIAAATSSSGAGATKTPLSSSTVSATSSGTKEKKSASGASEGSFLQASGTGTKDDSVASNLTVKAVAGIGNSAGDQPVATQGKSAKSSASSLDTSAISGVGTAHDEKKSTMSMDLNIPDMTNALSMNSTSRTTPEVNILLSSNNDFEDALKQVIHIAQLNDAAGSTAPTRIAIELQTPPGAIVNVYVSKQDDQYRAQLSASDPTALSWVQDKIASLRQDNDLAVPVKWLPAQLESGTSLSAATTSSNDSNLNWNRDGQNQNNQQSDDRSQSQRHLPSQYEDTAEAEADTFASSFAAVGGAA